MLTISNWKLHSLAVLTQKLFNKNIVNGIVSVIINKEDEQKKNCVIVALIAINNI